MNKKLSLILKLVNTVVVLIVLLLFIYTQVLFKRPAITESKERQRLSQRLKNAASVLMKKKIIPLEPITVNLDPYPGTDGKPKNHFLNMTVFIEMRDENEVAKFEAVRPVIMDKIIQCLEKKKYEDLNQVQGRYVFRSQIIDAANDAMHIPAVTEVYFSEFLLQ